MVDRALFFVTKFAKALAVLGLLSVFLSPATAQQDMQRPVSVEDKKSGDDPPRAYIALEEEMRAKRAIKLAEKEYQENLDRARDLSTLGASIVASFKQNNGLLKDDFKKLEKVEKLAKGIRQAAGGSEDKAEMEKPPKDLASAMCMLEDLSKSLKDKVEKTPKHVISAVVIDEANVLLEVIRIVRSLPPKV
jgi:hypothetical protein